MALQAAAVSVSANPAEDALVDEGVGVTKGNVFDSEVCDHLIVFLRVSHADASLTKLDGNSPEMSLARRVIPQPLNRGVGTAFPIGYKGLGAPNVTDVEQRTPHGDLGCIFPPPKHGYLLEASTLVVKVADVRPGTKQESENEHLSFSVTLHRR